MSRNIPGQAMHAWETFAEVDRARLLKVVEQWAQWLGHRPDSKRARAHQVRQDVTGRVPSLLGELQAEGAERARKQAAGLVEGRAAPRQFLFDHQVLEVATWRKWPLEARQAYVARYGSPWRLHEPVVWASTISGQGKRPSAPVADAVLAVDRAVARMPYVCRKVLLEHVFEAAEVQRKADTCRCSVKTYYRRLNQALRHVQDELNK